MPIASPPAYDAGSPNRKEPGDSLEMYAEQSLRRPPSASAQPSSANRLEKTPPRRNDAQSPCPLPRKAYLLRGIFCEGRAAADGGSSPRGSRRGKRRASGAPAPAPQHPRPAPERNERKKRRLSLLTEGRAASLFWPGAFSWPLQAARTALRKPVTSRWR